MSYINETDFVIENKKLVYPEIVSDGLQLYYDAKGKRDTDYHRDTMLDMSGNKNHGKLHNFAYEKHSGYKDGLVFDYIDDKLVRPTLNLKPDDFTFMLNGNIISFSPDGTVKRVQDGEVIESKGFNLIRNGNVESTYTYATGAYINFLKTGEIVGPLNYTNTQSTISAVSGHKYYVRAVFSQGTVRERLYFIYEDSSANYNDGAITETDKVSGIITANKTGNANLRLYGSAGEKTKQSIMMIDLTETFGAGNEPTKEQMDEIIQRFGFIPNAQDLIDRIEYKGNNLGDMENIIDGLYKTEVLSGEEIYTDKADDAVVHVEVDGKSYQHAGSGKNLFDIRHHTYSPTVTPNEWGGFDRSGGAGGFDASDIKVEPNQTYTFSYKVEYGTARQEIYDGDGSILYVLGTDSNVSFTPKHSTIRIQMSHYSGAKYLDSRITEIQLEKGSTATAYEPPAPSPDYPVEIHSLNDFDVVSSVGGRNYLSDSYNFTTTGNDAKGIVRSITEEGFLKIVASPGNGNYSSDWGMGKSRGLIVDNIEVGEIVTFSMEVRSEDSTQNPTFYFGDGMGYYPMEGSVGSEWSRIYVSRPWSTAYWAPHVGFSKVSGTFEFRKGKLEKGTTPTPWTPAPEDIAKNSNHLLIDKINLLLSEPLRSVGDAKDRLFRDSDGVWKIERKVGEDLLDSSSSMTNFGYSNYDTNVKTNRSFTPSANHDNNGSKARTTHFVRYKGGVWAESIGIGFALNSYNQFHISFPNSVLGIITADSKSVRDNKIKEWLDLEKTKGTPLTIQYSLRTLVIEILDQEIQDKLNNLRSFEDSNYVYTVLPNEDNYLSNNLKPTLHAKFLYNNWYKEDRVINNLMIYNRALTNEEMLQNYKTIKRRWGM